jgi:hypothetical protein
MSRPISKQGALKAFMTQVNYAVMDASSTQDTKLACEQTAFNILVLLDGMAGGFPSLDLVLRPHPDDKPDAESNGEDWYLDGMTINDEVLLHDLFKFTS